MMFRFIREESGASAVEFALMAPVLVLLLLGLADMGLLVVERVQIQTLTTAAAEYVVRTQDDTNLPIVAAEVYPGNMNDITLESEFECECADGEAQICPVSCADGDYQRRFISVSASGNFSPLFPYYGLSDNITLQSTARLRVD